MHYADITPTHIRAARALLGWSQGKLSDISGVAVSTVKRLETAPGAMEKADTMTRRRLHDALAGAGVAFMNGGQPGVRLMSSPQALSDGSGDVIEND